MAEQDPNTSSQQTLERPIGSPRADEDPLSHLHKMSTTAGLGSQDYVAISPLAVAAALLGIASALALMGTILLVIPVVAVLCSVAALRQVANSNGTQSGRGLAWLGLVLGIGFAAVVGGRAMMQQITTRDDQREIAALIDQFGQHVHQGEFDQAYALFSERFKTRVREPVFRDMWRTFTTTEMYGNIMSMRWNERLAFETDAESGIRYAAGMMIIEFERADLVDRQEARFRRSPGGQWQIDDIPQLFPTQQAPQQ
jgi:hypothetical protein